MKSGRSWWVSVTLGSGAVGGALDGHVSVFGYAEYRDARAVVDWAAEQLFGTQPVFASIEFADCDGRVIWSSYVDPRWTDRLTMPLKPGSYEFDEKRDALVRYSVEQAFEIDYEFVKRVQGGNPGRAHEVAEA